MFFNTLFDQAGPFADPREQHRSRQAVQRQREEAERRRQAQREMVERAERQRRARQAAEEAEKERRLEAKRQLAQKLANERRRMAQQQQMKQQQQQVEQSNSSDSDSSDEPPAPQYHRNPQHCQRNPFFPWGAHNPFGDYAFGCPSRRRSTTSQHNATTNNPRRPACPTPQPNVQPEPKPAATEPTAPVRKTRVPDAARLAKAARRSQTVQPAVNGPQPTPAPTVTATVVPPVVVAEPMQVEVEPTPPTPPTPVQISPKAVPISPKPTATAAPEPEVVVPTPTISPVNSARSARSIVVEVPAPEEAATPVGAASLTKIGAIVAAADALKRTWALAFTPIESEENRHSVTQARAYFEEGLLQQVLKLDSVDACGDLVVRKARKQAVIGIEAEVSNLKEYAETHDYDKKATADSPMRDATDDSDSTDDE